MARYRFTGEAAEVFPSIVLQDADGAFYTLRCEPGDEVDIVGDTTAPFTHPRLEPLDAPPPVDDPPAPDVTPGAPVEPEE